MGFPIPGLDATIKGLLDPDGPLAAQAKASETLAGALIAANRTNATLAQSNYALAESNTRLADALERAARNGVRV